MIYRRRASPLHAARAAAALAWFAALALALLTQSNPVVLGALTLALLGAGALAGVWSGLRRALWLAAPLAVTICVINALVTRDGLTVIWRLGEVPILGQTNITLEATVYGAILGLRAAGLVLLGALYSLAVDPDQVLRLFRRVSFRSALTATIATRMVPVLVRDSRRLAEAQRCRPGAAPNRVALMRATTAGMLDRALDVAAALEVRGYGAARRAPRPAGRGRAWSRHDLAFTAAAGMLAALAVLARVAGWAPLVAYPSLRAPAGGGVAAVACACAALVLGPFADRRGVQP
ncbi:MAG TPA: energy-coupling factor transporter transmembrane component T [Solirubrobacteraceae bacterium]|nr:energy-coupling factor transporter transmembrane component T [Solirubrobacteraceae bacterium]